jgi:AcrR family transcriptional regulator
MRDLCQEIGVSPGGLYRYFPSKEAIIQAMIETDRAQLETVFASLGPETSFAEVMEALYQVATDPERGMVNREQIVVNFQIMAEATTNEVICTLLRRHYDLMTDRLELVLRRSLERGEINSPMEPRALAIFVIALFDGLLSRSAVDDRVDPAQMARHFLDYLRALLAVEPSKSPARKGKGS